jgi:uncharacterized iron-regulated protein
LISPCCFDNKAVRRVLTGIVAVVPLLSACAQSPANSPIELPTTITEWESGLYTEHDLVGSLWHVHSNRLVSINDFAKALDTSRFVLLGEKHDNPDHHRIQQNILRYLLATEQVGTVSFEMMDSGFDERLAGLADQQLYSTAQLKDFLQWDDAGWNWSFYGPLIGDALAADIAVRSANISMEQMREVYAQPLEPAVANVMDAAAMEQLNIEIDESHCNMLPASQFPAMVRVQQARDHAMATSLSAQDSPDRKNVLIAGNYHVRQDLGVPNYLLALRPDIQRGDVLSLAILEVSPESDDPLDYLYAYSDLMPFDYVWFTPAISDEDYCAGLTTQ